MTLSVGLFRAAPLLVFGLMLSGCAPSGPKDEEKEQFFLAGKSRVNMMDFKGAVESFEKAVEVNPKSAAAHFELGCLYEQKEADPAAAIYHYERYLKLAPNSGKEELIKAHILACKQQLAQTVSLGPVTEKQQRELEQLVEENRRLREDLEKWRAFANRLQGASSQASPGPLPPRGAQPPASGGSAVSSASPPNSASPSRSRIATATTLRTHIVRAGETPIAIARKYGVKVEAVMSVNPGLDARHLRVGQALAIPAP
jgi:tetratricopeptide (TPR) repeat protein